MVLWYGLFLASFVTFALGKPMQARNMKVHERRETIPARFTLRSAAQPETTLKLRLALAQSNFAELERRLMDVSTPSSKNYGQHLSKEEVEQLVAPKKETVVAVNAWLAEHNISASIVSGAGDWIAFEVPVGKANQLLDANFSVFKHDSGMETIRTLSYSVPAELQGHIDLVLPTVTFPSPESRPVFSAPINVDDVHNLTSRAVPSECATYITPACLQALYNLPATKATQSSNKLAVTGYSQQYANQADLESFLTQYRPDMPSSTTFTLDAIDGGQNPQDANTAGPEANLDIQYTLGVATGVPTVFISVGGQNQDQDLFGWLDVANHLLAQTTPPHVLTTSYSWNEQLISQASAVKLCNAYAQLGARGISILNSAGDSGVAGNNGCGADGSFIPHFPPTCPYVTSVGGTHGIPETALPYTSGGFSNYFAMPSYQTNAVKGYLSVLGSTNSGKYNASGRAFPDVSIQSEHFLFLLNGAVRSISGTSAATPAFASVIALLNDRLIAAGKNPLGFLNPFLYSTGASAFNDITVGSNPGCNTDGFPAKAGWDPVTGLGTPDFNKLLRAVGL
ncbi:family S53 protease [Daedaleopsis nitida]|nr:family S53 protease [Daedaleopsis nitida]